MSVCRKLPDGTIQKIAGHTILLDANVSEIRTGTWSLTGSGAGTKSTNITFTDPMPDTDYIVVLEPSNQFNWQTQNPGPMGISNKTTIGFTLSSYTFNSVTTFNGAYTAFKPIKLNGYTELQSKVNNPDSTPTEDSLNLVTSGGVYDAILSASKIFINSESAWNELDAETKATYQVAILTDKPTVNAVDSTDGSTTVVANKNLVFKGTLNEWEALTTAQKKTYDEALITNDTDTGEVVNAVTDGDMRAVTSNAVYDAITELAPVDAVTNGNMKAVTSNAVYDAMNTVQTITPVAITGGAAGTITWQDFSVKKLGKVVTININNMQHTNDVDVPGAVAIATGLPKPVTGRFYLIGQNGTGAFIDGSGNFGIDSGFLQSTNYLYGSCTYICAE